ncbi:MAG: tetratricopeptide repeat protein [Acidobacteriota bacterium]|nr:tetratricopeptide repeat protein [Acidobacteriota bacterium]
MLKSMTHRYTAFILTMISLLAMVSSASAQSGATRPRRAIPTQPAQTPTPAPTTRRGADTASSPTTPAATPAATSARPNTSPTTTPASGTTDTTRAYTLLQQKQYAEAAKAAAQVSARDPKNSEAWKIAGFAKLSLKQFAEAASDLQRALDLQRAAKEEDAPTVDALAQAYVRSEKFEQALPLLTIVTTRKSATPDPLMLYYRGFAEYKTNKFAEAETSFNAAIKADPKNSLALFYLGRIAYDRKSDDAAINALNRAVISDPRLAEAWAYLTYSYLRRADAATGPKAEADYQGAVRASEGLLKVRSDEPTTALHAQALIRAQQYARAATALERIAATPTAQGSTLYLLGFAHSRAKNFPKAVVALDRAAAKSPDDVNIYRELGYAQEASKQYAKALAAYEKGLSLAPTDEYFKESVERVKPFAK